MARKELSGTFLSPERFTASLAELQSYSEVRLYHNSPQQTIELLTALATGNSSIQCLDIYTLAAGSASSALEAFLSQPDSPCKPAALVIHSCEDNTAAGCIGRGLANQECRVSSLSLTGLSDTQLAAVLQPLGSSSSSDRTLRHVSLLRCTVGEAALAHMQALAYVQSLSLTDCVAGDDRAQQLVQALRSESEHQQPSIQQLILTGCQAGLAATAAISSLLSHPLCQLTHLDLHNNTRLGDAGVAQIAAGLATNCTLQSLNLGQCGVGPAGAQSLAAALPQQQQLQTLQLNENSIGAVGLTALLSALSGRLAATVDMEVDGTQQHLSLHTLHIESNWIKGSELPVWPAGSVVQAPLRELKLAHNTLGDAGMALLHTALQQTATLVHLDVCQNAVGPTGAQRLAELLQEHPALQELKLDNNRIQDVGAAALAEVAVAHPALHVLHAEACRVVDPAVRARVAEVTQILAGRRWRQQRQSSSGDSDNGTPAVPLRVGKRFPAQDYTMAAAAASHAPEQQPLPPMPTPPGRVRMGSRFPPHVYTMGIVEDEGEGETQQASCAGRGKHMLSAEERDSDPRAMKQHESATFGGGGSDGVEGHMGAGMTPFRDWQPHSLDVAGHPGMDMFYNNKAHGGMPRYPERYSVDLPACGSGTMSSDGSQTMDLSCSPHSHAQRVVGSAGWNSVDLGNRTAQDHPAALRAMQSCGPQPVLRQEHSGSRPQGCHSAQSSVTYLVARPSLRKCALTPQQQALFDIF